MRERGWSGFNKRIANAFLTWWMAWPIARKNRNPSSPYRTLMIGHDHMGREDIVHNLPAVVQLREGVYATEWLTHDLIHNQDNTIGTQLQYTRGAEPTLRIQSRRKAAWSSSSSFTNHASSSNRLWNAPSIPIQFRGYGTEWERIRCISLMMGFVGIDSPQSRFSSDNTSITSSIPQHWGNVHPMLYWENRANQSPPIRGTYITEEGSISRWTVSSILGAEDGHLLR